jgi:hypothetical protein
LSGKGVTPAADKRREQQDAESDDPMSTAAALATAIAQGVDPSSIPTKPEDASDVSSDTDPFDELSDDSLHGDGEDLAANVVLEPEELNLCFEPELTPAALQLAPAVESEIRSDVTKPVQGLDEFSSVHWPGELTASESLKVRAGKGSRPEADGD